MYTEEFVRFKNGHLYTISFDAEGTISFATIYVVEMDAEVDITNFVKADQYWQARVFERLSEFRDTASERMYWDSHKDAKS